MRRVIIPLILSLSKGGPSLFMPYANPQATSLRGALLRRSNLSLIDLLKARLLHYVRNDGRKNLSTDG
jgi:hypothetical protein